MLTDYQLFAIGQAGWILFAPLATSVIYFAAARVPTFSERLLLASQGIVALAAFTLAVLVAPWTTAHSFVIALVFTGLMLLSLCLNFAAVYAYRGCVLAHLTQLMFVPSVCWVWLIGVLVLGHDWP